MTYFCTKCQRRHPIEDISADMWGICREELRGSLQTVLQDVKQNRSVQLSDEAIEDMEDELIRFLNYSDTVPIDNEFYRGKGRINAYFPLTRRNAGNMKGAREEDTLVKGIFTITLGELLDVCLKCSTDKEAMHQISAGKEGLPGSILKTSLCDKEVIMLLNKHGVLDRVIDHNNEPFVIGGKMLGFTKICSHCGCILSRAAGSAEEIVVALAGSARAGKSSSMVAMINTLISGSNPYIRVVPTPHDEYWSALESEITNYRSCKKITKTVAELTDVPFYSMLIQINDIKKTERVLTIVDMAGEFWSGEDGLLSAEFFAGYSRLYENLDCVWYVTSKATVRLSGIFAAPDANVIEALARSTSEEYEIIQRSNSTTLMGNLSLLKDQLNATIRKPMPPTVVIVTKPDFCVSQIDLQETRQYGLFPAGAPNVNQFNARDISSLFFVQDNRLYGINERNLQASATMVRKFIENKNNGLIAAIENNCEMRFYSVLSAYGRPAFDGSDINMSEPQPFHELFPLVWTLAVTGSIPVIHDVHWIKRGLLGSVISEQDTQEMVLCDYRKQTSEYQRSQPDQYAMSEDILNNLMLKTSRFQVTFIGHERR